jgi:hypothetical protein
MAKGFLGFECEIKDICNDLLYLLDCKSPIKYKCILATGLVDPLQGNISPKQGHTNCINESIKLFKQGDYAFWMGSKLFENEAQKKKFLNRAEEIYPNYTGKIIPLCYEEFLEQFVDHANKPEKLLALFSKKLATQGMAERYIPTVEDFLECDITIELDQTYGWWSNEGIAILNFLEDKRLILQYRKITYGSNGTRMLHHLPGSTTNNGNDISITIDGWTSLSQSESENSNKVFIAMSFSGWEDEERNAVTEPIKKACKPYDADIVDQKDTTTYITDKMIAEIRRSKFIVAEFTHHSRGVYYEAGFARALGKNVYHLVKEDHVEGVK